MDCCSLVVWFTLWKYKTLSLNIDYYAYDLPAALNIPLQEFLNTSTNEWNYHLNLFYALYSFPNIFLPFISGILMDKFGIHIFLFGLSIAVVFGQFLFSIGVSLKTYWIMHLGRFIFGVGGESLSVAQARITTRWFEGKELALALGLNLAIGRLGSVLNDLLSPYLAYTLGMNSAIWFGTVTCIISFGCCQTLVVMDKQFVKRAKSEENIDLTGTDTNTNTLQPSMKFSQLALLPNSFWLICLITCLYYAADIPFNAIHSSFLQTKWYKGDPQTASQIMAIPDTLSAVFVPAVGVFVDKYGHRCKLSILCGLMMAFIHFYFAFATASSPSPIPFLIGLGFSYAMLLIFWPSIPLIVPEQKLSTAFGFQASALNGSLAIFPILVAMLLNADPTYTLVELFFSFSCVLGIILSIVLYRLDYQNGGILEKPQKVSTSPTYTKLQEESLELAEFDEI